MYNHLEGSIPVYLFGHGPLGCRGRIPLNDGMALKDISNLDPYI